MATEMVRVLNTHNGNTGVIPLRFFKNDLYNKYLVEVDEHVKAYVPELFKSQTPEEFKDSQEKKAARKAEKTAPVVVDDDTDEPDSEKE